LAIAATIALNDSHDQANKGLTMTRTTEELAGAIRTALAAQNPYGAIAAVCQLWADQIEVVHHPAIDLDGLHEVSNAYKNWAHEWFMLGRAMPDFAMAGEIQTSGDRISVQYQLRGTLRDGSPVRATLNVRYTVAGGEIVKSESLGGDGAEGLMRALMDAGMGLGAAVNDAR
jgi:hypothetical protein